MDRLHWLDDPQFYLDASSDQERFLIAQFHLQQQLKRVFSLVFLLAMAELDATNPTFLTLPAQLKALEQDHLYHLACLQGRLFYRSDQYQYDEELDHAIYKPVQYTRAMIYDHITYVIHLPGDPRFAATVPLTFRVGQVVGWLSGLSVSQKDDAQAGMVLLSTIVQPLLLCKEPARALFSRSGKSQKK